MYSNTDLINEKLHDPNVVTRCSEEREENITYDKVRVHMIYGF